MTTSFGPEHLVGILADLSVRGDFDASILTDADGFLLASVSKGEAEKQAAVAALLGNVARRSELAALDEADEVTVRDSLGRRLVCRPFRKDGQLLVLAVLVGSRRPYRRFTNQAIEAIRQSYRP